MVLELSWQIIEKPLNFMKVRPEEAEFRADRRDEANSRFSQFCESA
jgi:hypothetical protein